MPPTLYETGNLVKQDWYKDTQEDLDKIRPIDYVIEWMSQRKTPKQASDRLLLLKAMTASGKSTVLPSELFHNFYGKYLVKEAGASFVKPRSICVTQPRAFNAVDIPSNQVAPFNSRKFLDSIEKNDRTELILGDNIGYQTGVLTFKPVRGLIFMTIGVLLQQMKIMTDEELIDKYSIIIVDEVHERSTETDSVLLMLKGFLKRNWEDERCPWIILTSATFNPQGFGHYFLNLPSDQIQNIIVVSGKSFPIEEHFAKVSSNDYFVDALEKIKYIHKEFKDDIKQGSIFRDILVFCAGGADIDKLVTQVNKLNITDSFFKNNPVLGIPLTGGIFAEQGKDYWNILNPIEKVFYEPENGKKVPIKRRIIMGTNVAETGITIDTLRHVIDIGEHQSSEFNHTFSCNMLIKKPITRDSATQRKGRVGRKHPGDWFPLYTEETFKAMSEQKFPDMITADITLNLLDIIVMNSNFTPTKDLRELFDKEYDKIVKDNLKLLSENIGGKKLEELRELGRDLFSLDLMSLPSADSLHYSIEKLYVLGAITAESIPTKLGILMSKFRKISLENIRMILTGYYWKVPIMDLIIMAVFNPGDLLKKNWIKTREKFFLIGVPEKLISTYKRMVAILSLMGDNYIEILMIYNKLIEIEHYQYRGWLSPITDEEYILEYNINYQSFLKGLSLMNDVIDNMISLGLNPYQWMEKGLTFSSFASNNRNKKIFRYVENKLQIVKLEDTFSNFTDKEKSTKNLLDSMIDKYIEEYKQQQAYEEATELTEQLQDIGLANLISSINIYSEPVINKIKLYKLCIFEGFKLNVSTYNRKEYKFISLYTHFPVTVKSHFQSLQSQSLVYDNIFMRYDRRSDTYMGEVSKISVLDGFIPIDRRFLNIYEP